MTAPHSSPLRTLHSWEQEFKKYGLQSEVIAAHLEIIRPQIENKIPVIFNFAHLAKLLGRTNHYLGSVINGTEHHYRSFKIPKRSGKMRTIDAPFSALLESQRWINQHILKRVKIHKSAQGFARRKSIITNAKMHVQAKDLLKVDIKDFFPSITFARIIVVFRSLGYSKNVSYYLARLCCKNDCLPQGAPTSPSLSNIVANQLDNRLFHFSEKFKLKYTRYADDLVFSGDDIAPKIIEYISEIVKDCGFNLNTEKTRLAKGDKRKIITGISVTNNRISVPSPYKRKLRQELHYVLKYGIAQHIQTCNIKNSGYLYTLLGRINFVLQVEPNNEYYRNASTQISLLISGDIDSASTI